MNAATLIVLVVLGQAQEPAGDPTALVEKLGSASYAEREATKSLENLGAKALPALRLSLKAKDLEVRMRAKALINKIESNLLTQESLVRLDFKDATPEEIVKSLSKQVGFEVVLGRMGAVPPKSTLAARRVTLVEPQPVAFWTAIDRLCEVGQLAVQNHAFLPRGQGVLHPALVLTEVPDSLIQPSNIHGPFHLSVVALTYVSRISFNFAERMRPQVRPGAANSKGARPPGEPAAAGSPGQSSTSKARAVPVPSIQFQVQLQILPEPRMTINRAGDLQVLEAVDELGQSLLPVAGTNQRAIVPMAMMAGTLAGGSTANLTLQLNRPQTPGKIVKTLRGTFEVAVSAAQSNPLVIPLEGAAGKSFQNEDRRVVVSSINHDPMQRQDVIELKIDNLEELFPAEPANGQPIGARAGMMAPGFVNQGGGNASQWPIQVVTSKGHNVFSQTSIDWDAGLVTLRVTQMPPPSEAKEIRISNIVRASAKIPFEFHDLPMP